MSELEQMYREFENLTSSLQEAKQLHEQFPEDWTLRMHISKAEYRLESLKVMMTDTQTPYQYRRA